MAKNVEKEKKDKQSKLRILNPDAAGIDIGSKELQVCVPEDRDENFNRTFDSFTCNLHQIAEWLKSCSINTVAMESTGIYWLQLFLVLKEYGFEVYLVNSKHIKQIGNKKNDVTDAQWIQILHSYGLLRSSFQPDNLTRQLRNLMRHRATLVESGSKEVMHMQKALESMNIKVHKVISDILGKSGQQIVQAIINGERDPHILSEYAERRVKASQEELVKSLEGNWSDDQLFILRQSHQLYNDYMEKVKQCDEEIQKIANQYECKAGPDMFVPAKKKKGNKNNLNFDAEKMLYMTWGVNTNMIPGISGLTSMKLLSELGQDFADNFPDDKKFVSWCNLVPNNKISGGRMLSSKIPKKANPVGQAFRMAASTLYRNKGPLGEYYRSIRSSSGKKQAVVATGHKLARIFYAMIKNKVEYDPDLVQSTRKISIEKNIHYLKKKLSKLETQLAVA